MDLLSIIIIAIALAMDAFSVSISCGMVIPNPGLRHYFRLAFHFGLFQFIMPVIGYFGGRLPGDRIGHFDHWVAFTLLALIGIKMIKDSLSSNEASCEPARDPSRGWPLLFLAVATSIDALAAGFSIGVMGQPIVLPSVIIGAVCAIFSVIGVAMGSKAAPFLGRRAETAGGVMLIAIGIKIVIEHTP
ncbi:MAG: manganese efflux pump [Chrysiogenales bacterium]|nr:MAG: manganese efflux pump [Chrysiogenales bacterium]